jgi:hypothetical protein
VMASSPEQPREHRIAEEQVALRRVAVLVARAVPPGDVFTAVTEEAGRLLGAGHATISRYEPGGAVSVVATWSSTGAAVPVGTRTSRGGRNVHTLVFDTGGAARIDDYGGVSGGAALRALARRSAVPVELDIQVAGRLPEPAEIAAYYAVAEALTNSAKHAHASTAEVEVAVSDGVLRVGVRDDGRGGANFSHGSGLLGLKDRVEALGGRISLQSPAGAGTALQIALPLDHPADAGRPSGRRLSVSWPG